MKLRKASQQEIWSPTYVRLFFMPLYMLLEIVHVEMEKMQIIGIIPWQLSSPIVQSGYWELSHNQKQMHPLKV